MRRALLILAAVSTLALAGTATAGGWATVQLSSLPNGLAVGQPWIVDVRVLQHGRTPLAGVKPMITIRKAAAVRRASAGSPAVLTFPARRTDRVGVYRARIVFPTAGTWRISVYDGFTAYGGARTHEFLPVQIARAHT
jgi:hypothetical protein